MSSVKKMSSSHDRKVDAYLKPINFKFVQQIVSSKNISASRAVDNAVTALREKMEGGKR